MKLTKSGLREIIREELNKLKSINEVQYAPLPDLYTNKLRNTNTNHINPKKKIGKSGLSLSQRYNVRERIGKLETELIELREKFAELNFEQEQTAEIEGGPIADRIGTEMTKVMNQMSKKESQIKELQKKLI